MNLMDNIDTCCEIGERASKEYHIENELKKMKKIWEDINFNLAP